MTIERHRHADLREYLARTGPAGVFARFVAGRRPDGLSLAAVVHGEVRGIAIGGRDHGLMEAYPHWILADHARAAAALAAALAEQAAPGDVDPSGISVSVADDLVDAVSASLQRHEPRLTHDLLCILRHAPTTTATTHGSMRIEPITTARLYELHIAPELGPMLGNLDAWTEGNHLYGVLDDGALVAIAESGVRDREYAMIQQVYTVASHRGRGLARELVASVAAAALGDGLTPLYLVDERNESSLRLAGALGFEQHSRWGYLEGKRT